MAPNPDSIWHERRFDPAANFSIRREFKIEGQKQKPGAPFDKALCPSLRTLRQLYEQRYIVMVDPSAAPSARAAGESSGNGMVSSLPDDQPRQQPTRATPKPSQQRRSRGPQHSRAPVIEPGKAPHWADDDGWR